MLAVLNILAALTVLAWPILAFGSAFLFDAPGSADKKHLQIIAYICWYYPAGPALGNYLFWSNRFEAGTSTLWLYTAVSYSGLVLLAIIFGTWFLVDP